MHSLRRRGWFGIQPSEHPAGALVSRVVPHSPAQRAGLRLGDVITAVNDTPITDANALRKALGDLHEGDTTALTLHNGRTVSLSAGSRPRESYEGLVTHYGETSDGPFALRTISVAPPGAGPFPTLVFLQGYTAASIERPEGVPAGDALGPLVAALARRGFCVWRTEKRGVGDSEGPPARDATFDDETDDHLAGLQAALRAPWVDRARVTLLGHSLGALHAPIVTARAGEVRAMVLYGAGLLPWMDYLAENTRRQCALAGLDLQETERCVQQQLRFAHAVLIEGHAPRSVLDADPTLRADVLGVDADDYILGRSATYWRGVARCDVASTLVDAARPTLALWGSSDWLTSRDEHEALATLARRAGAGLGHFVEVHGADHAFFAHPSPEASYRARWTGRLHDGVPEAIARFATRPWDTASQR